MWRNVPPSFKTPNHTDSYWNDFAVQRKCDRNFTNGYLILNGNTYRFILTLQHITH